MPTISGNLVDIRARRIFPAEVVVEEGRIASIREVAGPVAGYLLPGFVDAHAY
jgi:adenine deaminase